MNSIANAMLFTNKLHAIFMPNTELFNVTDKKTKAHHYPSKA